MVTDISAQNRRYLERGAENMMGAGVLFGRHVNSARAGATGNDRCERKPEGQALDWVAGRRPNHAHSV
jgi:hypothetical protein